MKKLDIYLLKAFIGPFFAILFIVVFILMMQFLWLYIDELVGKGLSFKVVMEFLFWGAATTLPLSMPLATVLASVMTLGNFSENYELTAIKAAGISLTRVLAPLTVASFGIAVGAFFVSNNLVPLAYNEIYTLRDDIGKTKEEIRIPTKTFYDGIDGYILRVEYNDKKTGMMHGVMVYNHTSYNGNTSLTMADSAYMHIADDKSLLTFKMFNGINYEEVNEQNYRDTTRQVQRTEFSSQEIKIPLENYEFEKTETGKYSDQAKAMTLKDLIADQDSIRATLEKRIAMQLAELQHDGTLIYNYQIDTVRKFSHTTVFDLDYIEDFPLGENIDVHKSAENRINEYIALISTYNRETYGTGDTLKKIDIEIYKKFSLALVCFLLFFVGGPIGALIRKGGLGTPMIISVLFFVLYYIVDMIGVKLANDGAIDPVSGTFIASYVLLPIGIFLSYKAINDESVFGNESLIARFKKVKTFIMEKFHKTRIVYMGTPEFATAPLQALLDKGYTVSAVVTVPDKASGRGLQVNESAVKKFAIAHNLPVLQPDNLKDPEFIEQLKSYKGDMFVVVAFRLLPSEVYKLPKLGTFNLHAALLPQYRGAAPINWAVINGERMTGVTSFLLDDGIDTGTILMREEYRIKEDDTASSVHDALMELGAKVVCETVEGLIGGELSPRVQKSFIQGSEVLRRAPKLSRELCHIDWNDNASKIVNLIRGLSDYPAAYTELITSNGSATALKIFKASKDNSGLYSGQAAGTVISDGKSYLGICANDGCVLLSDVQLAGKKRMGIEDFLRGMHEVESYTTSVGTSKSIIDAIHAKEVEQ